MAERELERPQDAFDHPRGLRESNIHRPNGGMGVTRHKDKYLELQKASEAREARAEEEADKRLGLNKPKPEIKCAGCGSKTHELLKCFKAAANGLMKGCPKCNTIKHEVDDCGRLKNINVRYRVLVEWRGQMPAFATENPDFHWASVYRQWMAKEESLGRRRRREPRFPWTPEFTQQLIEAQIQHYQDRLDKGGLRDAHLPMDPATQDWAAVQRTYPPRAAEAPSSQTQDKAARVTETGFMRAERRGAKMTGAAESGKGGEHAGDRPTENESVGEDDIDWAL